MRKNAVIVDSNGNIKHTITSMRMIHDEIEVTYINSQSINNSCTTSVSIFSSDNGDNRVFLIDTLGSGSVNAKQLKTPKTYEELNITREIVKDFNK